MAILLNLRLPVVFLEFQISTIKKLDLGHYYIQIYLKTFSKDENTPRVVDLSVF